MEPNDDEFLSPCKIGKLFMNRFVIEEDAGFEISNIVELEKSSFEMSDTKKEKGNGLTYIYNLTLNQLIRS